MSDRDEIEKIKRGLRAAKTQAAQTSAQQQAVRASEEAQRRRTEELTRTAQQELAAEAQEKKLQPEREALKSKREKNYELWRNVGPIFEKIRDTHQTEALGRGYSLTLERDYSNPDVLNRLEMYFISLEPATDPVRNLTLHSYKNPQALRLNAHDFNGSYYISCDRMRSQIIQETRKDIIQHGGGNATESWPEISKLVIVNESREWGFAENLAKWPIDKAHEEFKKLYDNFTKTPPEKRNFFLRTFFSITAAAILSHGALDLSNAPVNENDGASMTYIPAEAQHLEI